MPDPLPHDSEGEVSYRIEERAGRWLVLEYLVCRRYRGRWQVADCGTREEAEAARRGFVGEETRPQRET